MFVSLEELENRLDYVRGAPKQVGSVKLIVRRPSIGEREVLDKCELNVVEGLVGDNWSVRGLEKNPPKPANPDMQLNLMNARAIEIISKDEARWKLAGDQFYVDFDLSYENIPPGTQLKIGSAIIEITHEPHLGCKKFMDRFGKDAVTFVNSVEGKQINLRGVNAKVIKDGVVALTDKIEKIL